MTMLLCDLDAFYLEHRRCGELDAGVERGSEVSVANRDRHRQHGTEARLELQCPGRDVTRHLERERTGHRVAGREVSALTRIVDPGARTGDRCRTVDLAPVRDEAKAEDREIHSLIGRTCISGNRYADGEVVSALQDSASIKVKRTRSLGTQRRPGGLFRRHR